jgi:hypothetical protein
MRPNPVHDAPRGARGGRGALAGTILLACAAAAAAFLLAPGGSAAEPAKGAWKGYRVLLVESGADEAKVLDRLAAAGIRSAISESTEPITLSDWSRTMEIPLTEARRILVPGDPRLDSYVAGLAGWFKASIGGEAYRVVYVPEGPFYDASGRIERAMSGLGWRYILPESGAAAGAGPSSAASFAVAAVILAAAAAAGALLGRSRQQSPLSGARRSWQRVLGSVALRLAMAAPFAAIALRGGRASLAASLWGLAAMEAADALEPALEEFRRGSSIRDAFRSSARGGLAALAAPASALAAAFVVPAAIPALLAAVVSAAAATAVLALTAPKSRRRFSPLAIGGRRARASVPSLARAFLACLAVAAVALMSAIAGGGYGPAPGGEGVSYPLPSAARGSVAPLPDEARERIRVESAEGRLPSLASWLAHMAIQDSIPFSRLGEARPDPFAPASLPESGGAAARLEFGDEWARAAYRSIEGRSIEGMLASQGTAVVGWNSTAAGSIVRIAQPLAPISGLLYILLLIPPLARIAASIPIARGASSRRLRQEA